jgi:uncharacterized protein YaaN involved in tellurite resistance
MDRIETDTLPLAPEPPIETLPAIRDTLALLAPEEANEIKERAAELVRGLALASGSRELDLADSISAVGQQAQHRAGNEIEFLRARVGEMLSDKGAAAAVTRDLIELRFVLSKISPVAHERGIPGLAQVLPFSNGLVRRLEKIAVRYESVSRQVMLIERRLAEGRALLRQDNLDLRRLYEEVEAQQVPIERNAYLGETIIAELQELIARTSDAAKRERLQTVLFDVTMRVQDLRTMQEVHTQFFVSIDMTRVNNSRLGQAVERTLTLTTSTLTVGLAIQAALSRQKQVLEATERTREFLGDLVLANAASVKQHVAEIGDVYKNPVIAIDKLAQAHSDLIEAVNNAGRLEAEGIQIATENLQKLRQLTAELTQRSKSLALQDEAKSVEA